jgi:GNAT superfamily N-acetyltransferase
MALKKKLGCEEGNRNQMGAASEVAVKEVKSKRMLKAFIHLPENMHRGHPRWVPPIYREEWGYFHPRKNRDFAFCDTVLALAYQEGRPAGRIMGIINRRYNTFRQERNARFCSFECVDNQEVAHALLEHIECWARERGMEKLVGPMGFSDQDPEGFLIEGFEHEPTLATYYNFEHITSLLEKEGYTKEVDYVVYRIELPAEIPEFYKRISARLSKKSGITVIEFFRKKDIKPYVHPVFRLMNDCFKDIYGYLPLDEREMDELGKKYLFIMDPRFIKLVERNGDIIGFIIGMPNISEGIRKAKGRILPFGIVKILRSAKKTKQLDLLLGGIRKDHRGMGLDVLLGQKMLESAQKAGLSTIDSHHELETNVKMRSEMERLGGRVYKRFRIYKKMIRGAEQKGEK